MNGFGWDMQLERKFHKKHRLRLENSGWFQRYASQNSANQSDIDLELKYDFELNRQLDLGGEIWGSQSNRIGTNVLGEELTKNFAYNEIGTKGYFKSKLWYNAVTKVELSWRYRNFRKDPGIESLTYTEKSVSAALVQKFGSKVFKHLMGLEIELEDKPYKDRTASDTSGFSADPVYPKRHWRYLKGILSYGIKLKNRWEFEPFFELKHRADLFQGYFDYNQSGYGVKLGYENKRLDISFDFSSIDRQYLVREAPQMTKPYPDLNYRYFKYSLDLEYKVINSLVFVSEYNLIKRKTNVAIETMRTRRPYNYSTLTLGLEFEIEGIFK
jgi:hypothetical protein